VEEIERLLKKLNELERKLEEEVVEERIHCRSRSRRIYGDFFIAICIECLKVFTEPVKVTENEICFAHKHTPIIFHLVAEETPWEELNATLGKIVRENKNLAGVKDEMKKIVKEYVKKLRYDNMYRYAVEWVIDADTGEVNVKIGVCTVCCRVVDRKSYKLKIKYMRGFDGIEVRSVKVYEHEHPLRFVHIFTTPDGLQIESELPWEDLNEELKRFEVMRRVSISEIEGTILRYLKENYSTYQ